MKWTAIALLKSAVVHVLIALVVLLAGCSTIDKWRGKADELKDVESLFADSLAKFKGDDKPDDSGWSSAPQKWTLDKPSANARFSCEMRGFAAQKIPNRPPEAMTLLLKFKDGQDQQYYFMLPGRAPSIRCRGYVKVGTDALKGVAGVNYQAVTQWRVVLEDGECTVTINGHKLRRHPFAVGDAKLKAVYFSWEAARPATCELRGAVLEGGAE